jgi:hypothetical protein
LSTVPLPLNESSDCGMAGITAGAWRSEAGAAPEVGSCATELIAVRNKKKATRKLGVRMFTFSPGYRFLDAFAFAQEAGPISGLAACR